MALGSIYHVASKNVFSAALLRLFGAPEDVHGHFRIKPLRDWAQKSRSENHHLILEIGCGAGANIFELAQIMPNARYLGFDLSEAAIEIANKVANSGKLRNVEFHCQDCSRFNFEQKADVVLLMDFLEHIPDPVSFLRDLKGFVHQNSILIISVPTPLYRRVFGDKFHTKVGHIVDGYDLLSLSNALDQAGFRINNYSYNTGPIASKLCFLFYNLLFDMTGRPRRLVGRMLSCLRWADFFSAPHNSCTLFAVAGVITSTSSRRGNRSPELSESASV
jgi:SAM-dependent methyltransferase